MKRSVAGAFKKRDRSISVTDGQVGGQVAKEIANDNADRFRAAARVAIGCRQRAVAGSSEDEHFVGAGRDGHDIDERVIVEQRCGETNRSAVGWR